MNRVLKAGLVVAVLLLLASLLAPSSGYQFHNQILKADGGSLIVSADRITVSGLVEPRVVDGKSMVIQKISEMHAENLRIKQVSAQGVLKVNAAEARGSGIVQKVNVDSLENYGLGYLFKLLVSRKETLKMKNVIIKDMKLPVTYMYNRSVTLYGLEVSFR